MIRYHGRIDDQYGVGFRREKPTRRDLQGRDRRAARRQGGRDAADRGGGLPDRARRSRCRRRARSPTRSTSRAILQKRCQECHRPGEIGPFSLLTYDDAKKRAGADPRGGRRAADAAVARRPAARQVPQRPPAAAGGARHAAGVDRRGRREGRRQGPAAAGEVREGLEDRQAGRGLHDGEGVQGAGRRACSTTSGSSVDPGFKEDVWVQAAECRPGNRAVVHHILVYVLDAGQDQPVRPGRHRRDARGLGAGRHAGDLPAGHGAS